ncbi:MAG TPA: hypothetical protein VM577_16905 [Anaerovoracaceae bacterium]|nr:hypothetical protein [Anaerovoracaceae bacterium]
MRKISILIATALLFPISGFCQYGAAVQPNPIPSPVPAPRVYFCGGDTEGYQNSICYYTTQGNVQIDPSTTPPNLSLVSKPSSRRPNWYYDDNIINQDATRGNYVGAAWQNQFNVDLTKASGKSEHLVVGCPSSMKPTSATMLGVPVAILGGGTNLTFDPKVVLTLQQVSLMCS